MKHRFFLLLLLVLPAALFAQDKQAGKSQWLAQLGLNDDQVSRVVAIQKKTMTTLVQDRVHLRLIGAEIAQNLVSGKVDLQAVNSLADQAAQTRADLRETLIGAGVQLRQIMGDDVFRVYVRHILAKFKGLRRHAHVIMERRKLVTDRSRGSLVAPSPWAPKL